MSLSKRPGRGWTWLAAAAVGLLSFSVSARSISRFFEGGITFEFCQYAEIGRNLLEGRGYRTFMVTPFTLAYLDQRGIPFDAAHPAPVLDRFPLQSILSAVAEKIGGTRDFPLAVLSALILALCAAGTVLAGCAFFSIEEALFAGILLALDPSFQRGFVLWGLPDFGFLLTVLAATAALVNVSLQPSFPLPKKSLADGIVVGGLAGLAWLARSNFILWLPLFLWILWRKPGENRGMRIGGFLFGFLLVSSPGWTYNLRWFGGVNPPTMVWNLAHHTVQDTEPWLSYRVTTASEVLRHLPRLGLKFEILLLRYITDFPTLWQMNFLFPLGGLGAGLLLWGLFGNGEGRSAAGQWAGLNLAMLAIQVPVFSLLRYEALGNIVRGRYLIWFAPAAFLLAARGTSRIGDFLSGKRILGRRIALLAFAAANIVFFSRYLLRPQTHATYPEGIPVSHWPEVLATAALPDSGIVITNLPTQVAWYARKPAVALPATPEEAAEIMRRHAVSGVLISWLRTGELENTPRWLELLSKPGGDDALWRSLGLRVERDFKTSILLTPITPLPAINR